MASKKWLQSLSITFCTRITSAALVTSLLGGCATYQTDNTEVVGNTNELQGSAKPKIMHASATPSQPARYPVDNMYATYLIPPVSQEQQASIPSDSLIAANYRAAERLVSEPKVASVAYQTLAVATFYDVDQSEQTSALGKMISKQIASRLTQLGYRAVDLSSATPQQMSLSARERYSGRYLPPVGAGGIASRYAQALVGGAYAVTAGKVLINARFTDPSGSTVLSAYDYAVPMDRTLFGLINGCYQEGRWICPLP